MKFYLLTNEVGEVIGCERALEKAFSLAEHLGWSRDDISIDAVDVSVNAETVRRLLGESGGYAKSIKRVWGN